MRPQYARTRHFRGSARSCSIGSVSQTAHIGIGVVVAQEPTGSRWEPFAWRSVEAVYPAPEPAGFALLREELEGRLYLAGAIQMELHRKEAASYLDNLAADTPSLYVVLRKTPDGEAPLELHLVTASLTDVYAYGEGGDEVVGPVPMPPEVQEIVGAFAAEHYVEETFIKRRRKDHRTDEAEVFGQEPIWVQRQRGGKVEP